MLLKTEMLEETQNVEEDELRRQFHELAELAGSLAHEIKNPLAVIRMNVDLLGEELDESDWPGKRRAVNKVDLIRTHCERMEGLLRDFLRFAKLRDLDMTPGSLNDQMSAVLKLFHAQTASRAIDVVTYLDPDLHSVMLHSDSMQAALINLVKNAIEAMPGGGQLMVRTYVVPGALRWT